MAYVVHSSLENTFTCSTTQADIHTLKTSQKRDIEEKTRLSPKTWKNSKLVIYNNAFWASQKSWMWRFPGLPTTFHRWLRVSSQSPKFLLVYPTSLTSSFLFKSENDHLRQKTNNTVAVLSQTSWSRMKGPTYQNRPKKHGRCHRNQETPLIRCLPRLHFHCYCPPSSANLGRWPSQFSHLLWNVL